MTAEEFFLEELSGEPLTQRSVIDGLVQFAKMHCMEQRRKVKTKINETLEENYGKSVIYGFDFREKCGSAIDKAYPIHKIK